MASQDYNTEHDELLSQASCRSSGSTLSATTRLSGRPSGRSPPAASGDASQISSDTAPECTPSYSDVTTASEASTGSSRTRRSDTSGRRGRNWCFTLNNPTEPERAHLSRILPEMKQTRYLVFQLEAGEQETPHIQGYLEFTEPMRFNRVRSLISPVNPNRIHIELRRGTQDQAIDYCMKDEGRLDGPWEFGRRGSRNRGKRKDLDVLYEKLMGGWTDRQLLTTKETFKVALRYTRGIDRFREVFTLPRNWKTEVWVIVGPWGSGKSQYVREHPDHQPFDPSEEGPGRGWSKDIPDAFFNGYTGQEVVLFDEMSGGKCNYSFLLQLTDRYRTIVPVKGSYREWVPRRIFFCSNFWPDSWYRVGNWGAFQRRVDHWCFKPIPPSYLENENLQDFGTDYEAFQGMKALYEPPAPPAAVGTFNPPQDLSDMLG